MYPTPSAIWACATSEYRAKPVVSDRKVHKHPSTQLSEPGIPRTPRFTTESLLWTSVLCHSFNCLFMLHLPTLSTLHWPIFHSHSCLVQGPPSISSTWTNHFSTNFSTLPDRSISTTTLLLISSFLILSLIVTPHIPLKSIYDAFVSKECTQKESYKHVFNGSILCAIVGIHLVVYLCLGHFYKLILHTCIYLVIATIYFYIFLNSFLCSF